MARPVGARSGPNGQSARHDGPSLSPVQQEIVQVCSEVVHRLGLSRSYGQIFGVIYCSPRPLAFADVVERLRVSKGTVSRGLHFLRELGAIRLVRVPGNRCAHFVSETELRRLIGRLLQTRLRVPLQCGAARLRTIGLQLVSTDEPNREFLEQRLDRLQTWHRKALFVLPLIQCVLGPGKG